MSKTAAIINLKAGSNGHQERWRTRIDRAEELRDLHPGLAPALGLYRAVLAFQFEVARASNLEIRLGTRLREQIDPVFAASHVPSLLSLVVEYGPEGLAHKARMLQQEGEQGWRQILEAEMAAPGTALTGVEDFFARACLQPIAENLQAQLPRYANYSHHLCPACGSLPQLSVLRPEGEGASRWLMCSFCLREWLFRRIVCPWCGEEDKEKLPRYSAKEYGHVHLEACDTCMRYLKAVDKTIDGRAVPLVDDAAAAVLDVWGTDHGYTKIIPNLLGF